MDRERPDGSTVIVFPRISNKDGPAQTIRVEEHRAPGSIDESVEYDPVRFGVADAFPYAADKKIPKELIRPTPNLAMSRNAQRFRRNYKTPDHATRALINRRRGT